MPKPIVVYEHSRLNIGEQDFNEDCFNALVKYNDRYKGKYFNVGYNKIIFKSYVGVLQVGNRVIEILPKADGNNEDDQAMQTKWQNALLYMLRKAGYIKLNKTGDASQHTSRANLMEVYLFIFLKEVEQLIHAGLVKKYKRTRQNQTALKGRLLIEKQIQYNTVHKERFYTEHTIYNRDNVFNSILKTALEIIYDVSTNASVRQVAAKQLLYFDGIASWTGNSFDFDKLKLDRKTQPYRQALELARMIILNYCPDMRSGTKHVLALLFDMNRLFEKFIYRALKSEEANFKDYRLYIARQTSQPFWEDKSIIPDIIVEFVKTIENKDGSKKQQTIRIIIDTKWKIAASGYPADDDLKQMYAYNMQFGADHSILLYPHLDQTNSIGAYKESARNLGISHSCEMHFIKLFDGNIISRTFANAFIFNLIKA